MKTNINDIKAILEEADTLVEIENIKPELGLVAQGIDSLDMANIYLLIEEKYDITIPDEDLSKVTTIDDIISYIENT